MTYAYESFKIKEGGALLSVILPTYNERENIIPLVSAIRDVVSGPLEILIVDDDSPDRTWEVAENLGKQYEEVHLIRRMENRGLTASLNEGIAHSKGEHILWMDADFSMLPETIPSLIRSLETHAVAIGSRYIEGGKDDRPLFRVLLSRWFNKLAALLLGNVSDYTTGFVATRREVWERLGLSGIYGEYCIRFLCEAKRAGYAIREVPYICRPRQVGYSKTFSSLKESLKHGKDYLWTLFSLWIARA